MRVDPNLYSYVGAAINTTAQALQTSVTELSSGLRVATPSDDPAAAASNLRSLAGSAAVDRYTKNSDALLAQNQMADSVLSNVVGTLTQAMTLGTQAANGSTTPQQRTAIATQVQALLQQVVAAANTKFNGASLFSGGATGVDAFIPDSTSSTGYTYQGDNTANQVPVGDNLELSDGVPGNQIFNSPGGDAIGSLAQMVNALNTGTPAQIADTITAVKSAIDHIGHERAIYAGVANSIQSQESYLSQETVSLTSQQQALTGIDTATAIEQLTQAQTAHTAVLAAAAKILPTSLLNYLNPAG